MNEDIGIAMSQQAKTMRHLHTTQPKLAVRNQAMYVKSKTYALHLLLSICYRLAAAIEQILNSVKIKGQRDTQRLVQRIAWGGSDDVARIN